MTPIFSAILGGLIGLLAKQVMLADEGRTTTVNVILGALGAAIGGWLILPAMGPSAFLGAALGAGLFLSIVNLVRRRGIP